MEPNAFFILVVVMYFAGGVLSVILPYARKWAEGEVQKWDWRMVLGRFIGIILVAAPTFGTTSWLAELQSLASKQWLGIGLALVAGLVAFGASSFGHQMQRTPEAVRAYRNGKK